MQDMLENNSDNSNKTLDPLTCQLWVMMVEKLRYTRFISTKELEKLKTCNNLNKLDDYFKWESKILEIIFDKNPKLQKKNKFQIFIKLDVENEEILDLLQAYVSIDYIRLLNTGFDENDIEWVKIFIEKQNERFYISNIKIVNK